MEELSERAEQANEESRLFFLDFRSRSRPNLILRLERLSPVLSRKEGCSWCNYLGSFG